MQKKRVVYKRTKVMDFLPGRIDFWLCAGCDCGHVVSKLRTCGVERVGNGSAET